jgi:hypothetical protein
MSRTLLAVGIAVLTSMTFIPRGHVDILRSGRAAEGSIQEFLPFFYRSRWPQDEILWQAFAKETFFLVVFAALIVNFPWQRKRRRD